MVAVTISEPVLTGLNEVMVPEPAAANPIEVVLLVQLYTTPALYTVAAEVKATMLVEPPAQTT